MFGLVLTFSAHSAPLLLENLDYSVQNQIVETGKTEHIFFFILFSCFDLVEVEGGGHLLKK